LCDSLNFCFVSSESITPHKRRMRRSSRILYTTRIHKSRPHSSPSQDRI
jgi:hypothetical protein